MGSLNRTRWYVRILLGLVMAQVFCIIFSLPFLIIPINELMIFGPLTIATVLGILSYSLVIEITRISNIIFYGWFREAILCTILVPIAVMAIEYIVLTEKTIIGANIGYIVLLVWIGVLVEHIVKFLIKVLDTLEIADATLHNTDK